MVLLAVLLCALPVASAFCTEPVGADAVYGCVQQGSLHLRKEASEGAESLGIYESGTWVSILDDENNGDWLRVVAPDGKSGYMEAKFLLQDAAGTANTGYVHNDGKFVNLHTKPSLSAPVLQQVSDGSPLKILTHESGWYRVLVGENDGFIVDGMVSTDQKAVGHKYVHSSNGGSVNMRLGPTTDAEPIISLAPGTEIDVLIRGAEWDKVRAKGRIGYMMTRFMSDRGDDEHIPSKYTYAYVATNNATSLLRLREAPNTVARILGSYANGTRVKVYSFGDYWDEVEVDGKHGYMNADFISTTGRVHDDDGSVHDGTPDYNSDGFFIAELYNPNGGDIVNFRSAPSSESDIISSQSVGSKVEVYSRGRDWCKVRLGGEWGYVSSYFLRYSK